MLTLTVNLTRSYVDLEVDTTYNPLEDLEATATYDGAVVLNTGTDYVLNAKGLVNACGTCNFEANLGWQLWTIDASPTMISDAYTTVTNLPSWGGQSPFTRSLPPMNSSAEGIYTQMGLVQQHGYTVR